MSTEKVPPTKSKVLLQEVRCPFCRSLLFKAKPGLAGIIQIRCPQRRCREFATISFPLEFLRGTSLDAPGTCSFSNAANG